MFFLYQHNFYIYLHAHFLTVYYFDSSQRLPVQAAPYWRFRRRKVLPSAEIRRRHIHWVVHLHHRSRLCKYFVRSCTSVQFTVSFYLFLTFLLILQKIRTVELDGKTIKLQIVSLAFFRFLFLFFHIFISFFSGTLLVRSASAPSRAATTVGLTELS